VEGGRGDEGKGIRDIEGEFVAAWIRQKDGKEGIKLMTKERRNEITKVGGNDILCKDRRKTTSPLRRTSKLFELLQQSSNTLKIDFQDINKSSIRHGDDKRRDRDLRKTKKRSFSLLLFLFPFFLLLIVAFSILLIVIFVVDDVDRNVLKTFSTFKKEFEGIFDLGIDRKVVDKEGMHLNVEREDV